MQPIPSHMALVPYTPKRKRGRPSRYTPAVGRAICKMLAGGMTLNQIGARKRMPPKTTILRWASNPKHPFSDQYVRAREVGYLAMADEITDIADDGRNDWEERETRNGSYIALNREAVMRSALRIDARKWILARALPKIYGNRVETTHKLDVSQAFLEMHRMLSGGKTRELVAA